MRTCSRSIEQSLNQHLRIMIGIYQRKQHSNHSCIHSILQHAFIQSTNQSITFTLASQTNQIKRIQSPTPRLCPLRHALCPLTGSTAADHGGASDSPDPGHIRCVYSSTNLLGIRTLIVTIKAISMMNQQRLRRN